MASNITALRLVGMLLLGFLVAMQPGPAFGQEEQIPEKGKAAEEPACKPKEEPAAEPPEEATAEETAAEETAAEETAAEEAATEETAAETVEGEQPFKLIKMFAEEWKWTPKLIRVAQGTRLRIEFLSYGASRRFDLKGYRLKVRIPQDKLVSVEFVADKKGTFRWRCGRPCGNGCAKMNGKLIVE